MADVELLRNSSLQRGDSFPYLNRPSDDLPVSPGKTPSRTQHFPPGTDQEGGTYQTSPSRLGDPSETNPSEFKSPQRNSSGFEAGPSQTNSANFGGPSESNPSEFEGPSSRHSAKFGGPSESNPSEFESLSPRHSSKFGGPSEPNPSEFEGPSERNLPGYGGPSPATFGQGYSDREERRSLQNSPYKSDVQASEEESPFAKRRESFGEESMRKRRGSRPPSSEREREPARRQEGEWGEGGGGERMRGHSEREGMGVPHPYHPHHHPHSQSEVQFSPGKKFQEERPGASAEDKSEERVSQENINHRPLHHPEEPPQPLYPQRGFPRDFSHGHFQPQPQPSPRWRKPSSKDYHEHAAAAASSSTAQDFSSTRWDPKFKSPGKLEPECEESLDLSNHSSVTNPSSAQNQSKRFPFSPERDHSSIFRFSALQDSPNKLQASERRHSSSVHFPEDQKSSSPSRMQVPGRERAHTFPASGERERHSSFRFSEEERSPTKIQVSGRERAHTFSTNRERESAFATKDHVPGSSPSSSRFPRNGEFQSSLPSASKLFSSPYSSSSSPSSSPSPSYNPEHSSSLKQEHPQHDTGEERVDPARDGTVSASSAFPEERRTSASSSSGGLVHPDFSKFPMPSMDHAAFPGGWSPYQGLMVPGGHMSRMPLMPLMGAAGPPPPPPPPPVPAPSGGGGGGGEGHGEREGQGRMFSCHLCDYVGSSQEEFNNHMSVHYKFTCNECGYKSRTEGRLLKHIKDFHSDPSQHRVTPSRPKVFRCKQCEFTCTDRTESWKHRRVHIKEEKRLECPQCPFVTEYKHHLEYHLLNHLSSKPFKCQKCNYSCVNKSMLNSHMKSHTKACQYRCRDCNFAAKYSHSMKSHLAKNNHRMGAVMNSDGSVPQYDMSGAMGGGKKGPHRSSGGPKDGDFGGSFMPGFFPMPPSPGVPHPVPGLNPMMHNGMFPFSFWPVMASNGEQPSPIFDMRAMGGPGYAMPTGAPDKMERFPVPTSFHSEQDVNQSGSRDNARRNYTCSMCAYTCESSEMLHGHMLKVHGPGSPDRKNMILSKAPETRIYNQYHPSPSTSTTTACQTSIQEAARETVTRKESVSSIYTHLSNQIEGKLNHTAASVRKPLMTYDQHLYSELLRRENAGSYRDIAYLERQRSHERDVFERHQRQQADNQKGSGEGVNILRQMTERFGSAASTSPPPFVSRLAQSKADKAEEQEPEREEPETRDQNPRSGSPVSKESSGFAFENTPAENLTSGTKRQHPESETRSGENSTPEPAFQPRKRSRKGRAFRRDTLYLKRQEQQQQLEAMNYMNEDYQTQNMMDTDNSEEDKEKGPKNNTEMLEDPVQNDQYNAPPVDEDEHFKQLQKDIQLLNSDPSQDNPQSPHENNPERPVTEAEKDSRPTECQPEQEETDPEKERERLIQLVCMNRRRPVPASLRRGSEVAWKMMNDPSLGLKLPPEALDQPKEEEASLSPPEAASSVNTSRHHSFSEGQSSASFTSPDKARRMSLPWSATSPYTLASRGSQGDDVSVPSSSEASALALTRKDHAVMPGHQNPSAWMNLNMPVPPFMYEPHPPAKEHSPFRHYSHRSSTSSQTIGMSQMADYNMLRVQQLFGRPPPSAYPTTPYVGRPYECQYCEMSFKDVAQYNIHMSFHQKDNPFKCSSCGCVSDNKVDFYRHLVTAEHS